MVVVVVSWLAPHATYAYKPPDLSDVGEWAQSGDYIELAEQIGGLQLQPTGIRKQSRAR
jgi:hypothetical protein